MSRAGSRKDGPRHSDQGKRPLLHVICQAHLDPVWLWPWRDGVSEVLTTLQSAVDRMREFPDMRYACSAAYAYRWVQETDPRLFREIRKLIAAGRWEVVGGWVVQADTNLPGAVSLHRQGQLAQAWFRDELGVTAKVGYCVDSFGHSAGVPSILAASGMRYFVFHRPFVTERPDLPNLFWWEGPDGARVLAWRLAVSYGQAPGTTADSLEQSFREQWRQMLAPGMATGTWFVGIGNHGGGPTRAQVQRVCELRDRADPSLPAVRFSTLAEYFADVERQPGFGRVPVVRGELLHHARGCYVSNSRFKRMHRQAERELVTAESLCRIGAGRKAPAGAVPPKPPAELADAWWTLCFNQFHDILPGSSVAACYRQAQDDLGAVRQAARQVAVRSVHRMARRADTRGAPEGTVFLVNPLPWRRTGVVMFDTFVSPHGDSPITHLAAPGGECLPLQWAAADAGFGPFLQEWRKLVAAVPIAADGSRWFNLAHGPFRSAVRYAEVPVPLRRVAESAGLVAVADKADSWGHGFDRWDTVVGRSRVQRAKVLDDGPVFRRTRRWLRCGRSEAIVDIVEWKALGAVELVVRLNWRDRYQMLKLELPLALKKPALKVKTMGASVERPLDGNEAPWQDWISVEAGRQRLVIVGDGTSGYDATEARLRLTLLRCVPHAQHIPVPHPEDSPDAFLDEGWQEARFWLAMPAAAPTAAALDRLAAQLSTPLEHMLDSAHPGRRAK